MSNVADEQDTPEPTIAEDLKCTRCGYNLRGLTLSKLCPECGTPIERSIHGNLLKYADPDWVNKLRLGALLTLWNLLIAILLGAAAGALPSMGMPQVAASMLSLIGGIFGLWAIFLLTTPEPAIAFEEDPITLRKLVRTCAVINFVGQTLQQAALSGGLQAWVFIAGGVMMLVGIVYLFGQFIFLRRFAERIPDTRLAKNHDDRHVGLRRDVRSCDTGRYRGRRGRRGNGRGHCSRDFTALSRRRTRWRPVSRARMQCPSEFRGIRNLVHPPPLPLPRRLQDGCA